MLSRSHRPQSEREFARARVSTTFPGAANVYSAITRHARGMARWKTICIEPFAGSLLGHAPPRHDFRETIVRSLAPDGDRELERRARKAWFIEKIRLACTLPALLSFSPVTTRSFHSPAARNRLYFFLAVLGYILKRIYTVHLRDHPGWIARDPPLTKIWLGAVYFRGLSGSDINLICDERCDTSECQWSSRKLDNDREHFAGNIDFFNAKRYALIILCCRKRKHVLKSFLKIL